MEDFENLYAYLFYLYLGIGLLYMNEGYVPRNYLIVLGFFVFKMITAYEKCTISYLECKLRNVKKENGYIYDFLHSIISLRSTTHAKYIYIISLVLFFTLKVV